MLSEVTGDDQWSDEEDQPPSSKVPEDVAAATRRIQALESKLQQAQQDLKDYRSLVKDKLNLSGLSDVLQEASTSAPTHAAAPLRDDDSHYFQSYGENGKLASCFMLRFSSSC